VAVGAFGPVVIIANQLLSAYRVNHKAAKTIAIRVLGADRNLIDLHLHEVALTINFECPEGLALHCMVFYAICGSSSTFVFLLGRSQSSTGRPKARLKVQGLIFLAAPQRPFVDEAKRPRQHLYVTGRECIQACFAHCHVVRPPAQFGEDGT
jgi:hypothetical protein